MVKKTTILGILINNFGSPCPSSRSEATSLQGVWGAKPPKIQGGCGGGLRGGGSAPGLDPLFEVFKFFARFSSFRKVDKNWRQHEN